MANVRLKPPSLATLPATAVIGDLVVKTGSGAGLYVATATNTWTAVSTAVGTVTTSGSPASGDLAQFSSATAITTATQTGTGAVVRATGPTLSAPVLGTPASGTLTNCTLPVGGVTGLGTNVAAFLATPSSANLLAALTDETGTGAAVFGTNPTLSGATLADATLADATNVALNTGTGSKIGTGATQKLGFWNAAPIVQPTTAGAAATFDGYTIGQVVKALRNAGLLA